MGILTEEMKRVLSEIQVCYAATVTSDGYRNLLPKGSITVLSDEKLGFADLGSRGTTENRRQQSGDRPQCGGPAHPPGLRFQGRGGGGEGPRSSPADRADPGTCQSVGATCQNSRRDSFGSVSPVYTLTQASKAEVKRFWLERYGYRSAREVGGGHDCP